MNLKNILANPDQAIVERWKAASTCPHQSEIMVLVAGITNIKQALKQEAILKRGISSQFKEQPEETSRLKEKMCEVSIRINEYEKQKKAQEKHLLEIFKESTSIDEVDPIPPRFKYPLSNKANNSPIDISLASDSQEWDDYVNQHNNASAYHSLGWKLVIENTYGHDCPYLIARNKQNQQVIGILPLVGFKSSVFGSFAVSLPFLNYGGPLTDSSTITAALIDRAREIQTRKKWRSIEFRCCDDGLNLPRETKKASMVLRLPDRFEKLEKSLGAKVRAQYKRAENSSPTITFGGLELLDEYYRVFARNMRDLGTPVESKKLFREILTCYPEQTTIVVARISGKALGSAFLFGYKDMLEIPWASTLREANPFNLNMWMYKNILVYATEKKYDFFDFGRSTINAGTYKFKKQWGAKPVQHYWYYSLDSNDKQPPQINPDNPKFKIAIAIWKRLPLFLTNLIGPAVAKNLP